MNTILVELPAWLYYSMSVTFAVVVATGLVTVIRMVDAPRPKRTRN